MEDALHNDSLELTSPPEIVSKKPRSNNPSKARARRIAHVPKEQEILKLDTAIEAIPTEDSEAIDVPPKAFDVMTNLKDAIRLMEMCLDHDRLQAPYDAQATKVRQIKEQLIAPLLGQLREINSRNVDPELSSQRNVLCQNVYAFEGRAIFSLFNSAVFGDCAFKTQGNLEKQFQNQDVGEVTPRVVLDSVVMLSNWAFSGNPQRVTNEDPTLLRENVNINNSIMYGNHIGRFLEGGEITNSVIGGEGLFAEAHNLHFKNVHIVTPHGEYLIEDETMERFTLKEEWRVK